MFQSYIRATGDGIHNFEPQLSDKDDTEKKPHFLFFFYIVNFEPQDLMYVGLSSQRVSLVAPGNEPTIRQKQHKPQVRDYSDYRVLRYGLTKKIFKYKSFGGGGN
ncbi:hypothetical protein TNCV_2811541 [Trichonephila clavipes]|nr:hypothetical protein TNCV_2811541 [Trichonephila clavipes]